MSASVRRTSVWGVLLSAMLPGATAFGQVPIPLQEQVQRFNSLPPAQQQSLIREMQSQLPPAQRDAVVGLLQGRQGGGQQAELDPEAAAALQEALNGQTGEGTSHSTPPWRDSSRTTQRSSSLRRARIRSRGHLGRWHR